MLLSLHSAPPLQAVEHVSADDVEGLASSSFPLCMANLQSGLKDKGHLRHGGRMQYGLFLKGVGLSLEDALVFWQAQFTKSMTADAFLKQYAYNIRHNYGKEGKRVDYTPYSCSKIISGPPPGAGKQAARTVCWLRNPMATAARSGAKGAPIVDRVNWA